ncbi:MAG: T9SS C-terminal target domain-containing protein, partial [Chitinophagia bacterium]|nr:T9SS C-terminal target domain-containing protein [Chitinophagia bacterium]
MHAAGQSTLNATGGSAFIGGAEFEWSVGEMALVNTFTTSTIVVTQGVLQTGLRDATLVPDLSAGAHLRVYPNPANNIVNVAYDATASGSLTLRLSDLAGRILLE